jgi:hypothetical protein
METMRNSWTDDRLDDGFDRVTADIALLRGETRSLRRELHEEIGSLRKELQQEIRSLHRIFLQIGGGVIVALIGVIATQL